MPPVGFEPKISAGEQSQTYALDRAATGTGLLSITAIKQVKKKTSNTKVALLRQLPCYGSYGSYPRHCDYARYKIDGSNNTFLRDFHDSYHFQTSYKNLPNG